MSARRFVSPEPGDDFDGLAARVLPETEDAAQELLSWNLHLAARRALGPNGGLLPSDIVFIEPPLPTPAPGAPDSPAST